MTPRTATHPPNDARMWKRLVSRAHPDTGGDHELFIWATAVRDVVCSSNLRVSASPEPTVHPSRRREASTPRPAQADDPPRVPWDGGDDFEEVTRTALLMGAVGEPYGRVLSLLADCKPLDNLAHEQQRGASYKRLAAIAHAWGMTKAERVGWYRVAEDLPLSDRHAGHILSRLKRRAA